MVKGIVCSRDWQKKKRQDPEYCEQVKAKSKIYDNEHKDEKNKRKLELYHRRMDTLRSSQSAHYDDGCHTRGVYE